MPATSNYVFEAVIDDICSLRWEAVTASDLMKVAKAYYYFSIQFRENLELACQFLPEDGQLRRLHAEECNTDNLSPWPDVASPGEKMDHDEFMRRLLTLEERPEEGHLDVLGHTYLSSIRKLDNRSRAVSIASYEDGGLTQIFNAFLRAKQWSGKGQLAFKHFLEQHIKFDSEGDEGHGTLVRHLMPDDRILPLWEAFRAMLVGAVPALERERTNREAVRELAAD